MNWLGKYFLRGLVILAPIAGTVYVLFMAFSWLNEGMPTQIPVYGTIAPAMSFVFAFLFITLVGFLGSIFIGRWLVRLTDTVLRKLPFIKLLYGSIKDLISAFIGEKKSFNKPVSVTVGPGGVRVLGFVTSDDLESFGLPGQVAVYLPQSYNFAGNLLVMPRDQVEPLEADSGDVMKFLVSGGVATHVEH